MTKLTVAVQADPIASFNPDMDSTLVMMREAQRRGYALYHYTIDKLTLKDGMPVATAQAVTLRDGNKDFFTLGKPETLKLADADIVLMRQDPPFDMAYMSGIYMLERLEGKTLVLNNPKEVRAHPEKLFPLEFPEFIPPTLVTANPDDIRAFHREQGEMVLKPLYGHGGIAVFFIDAKGSNLGALMELFFSKSKEPLVAQKFVPAKSTLRAALVNGKIAGQVIKIPSSSDIRSNMHAGGTMTRGELTPGQRKVLEAIGPVLAKKRILFAGIDLIEDMLLEINITSPGGLKDLQDYYGLTPERDFWDAAERLL